LSTVKRAAKLLGCFVAAGRDCAPKRYGSCEPLRSPFDSENLHDPAKVLSERPRELYLRAYKPSYVACLRWGVPPRRRWPWSVYFQRGWRTAQRHATMVPLFLDLCARFPPVFVAAASGEDWDGKHRIVDPAWMGPGYPGNPPGAG
jgi:hypothetical protein